MKDIARESLMSVLIKMYFNETEISSGTGFFVCAAAGPLLITNRHNVTGRHQESGKCLSKNAILPNRIAIYHHEKGNFGSTIIKNEDLYQDEEPLWIEHPSLGKQVDFVALKLTDTEGTDIYSYSLDEESEMKVGVAEVVSVVGFPFGLRIGKNTAVWATGFIASEPTLDYDKLPLFLIDCRARQGQSGSAVVAYRPEGFFEVKGEGVFANTPVTKLLGIYSGRINPESDLGMVWKASAIRELVSSIK